MLYLKLSWEWIGHMMNMIDDAVKNLKPRLFSGKEKVWQDLQKNFNIIDSCVNIIQLENARKLYEANMRMHSLDKNNNYDSFPVYFKICSFLLENRYKTKYKTLANEHLDQV